MSAQIRQWAPAILIMILIFAASATPGSELPNFGLWDIIVKKGGHMLGYVMLTVAYCYALTRGKTATRTRLIVAFCLAALYAISDECHQRFTPGRSPSPLDVAIDTAGSAIGLLLWHSIRTLLTEPRKSSDVPDS
jgi:VanZ family protein